MEIKVKRFDELNIHELYKIMKLRVNVFVVEQNCAYKELDDLDQEALHVWLEDEGEILAYLRVMDKGAESEHVSIGRVVTSVRHKGYGSEVLKKGIEVAKEVFNADKIYLEAQSYATVFYERQGFITVSDEFLLDGIPHVKMLREENE